VSSALASPCQRARGGVLRCAACALQRVRGAARALPRVRCAALERVLAPLERVLARAVVALHRALRVGPSVAAATCAIRPLPAQS
jgi:hypothetical protein